MNNLSKYLNGSTNYVNKKLEESLNKAMDNSLKVIFSNFSKAMVKVSISAEDLKAASDKMYFSFHPRKVPVVLDDVSFSFEEQIQHVITYYLEGDTSFKNWNYEDRIRSKTLAALVSKYGRSNEKVLELANKYRAILRKRFVDEILTNASNGEIGRLKFEAFLNNLLLSKVRMKGENDGVERDEGEENCQNLSQAKSQT